MSDTVKSPALQELEACLEILAEFVDGETVLTPGNIEFVSAVAQVLELVPLLVAENDQAWETIDALKQMAAITAAQQQAMDNAPNRAARRALQRRKSGLVVPR